jgi:hypothetical protein
MAGDWINIKTGIEQSPKFHSIARDIDCPPPTTLYVLYQIAAWFKTHGVHGKMKCSMETLDHFVGVSGTALAMSRVGWLREDGGVLTLHSYCDTSATRKSLSGRIRAAVLAVGKCAACGSTNNLVVDHVIPIARGGSCDIENLQPLCQLCNISKGQKLPEEWSGR